MTSKINRKDIIGPLTDEQANHVWQILHDAGEPVIRTRADYCFEGQSHFGAVPGCFAFRWGAVPSEESTISYESFVAKMSTPNTSNPKWLNTKWDVRNWTTEQKIAFQEECFRCGCSWGIGRNKDVIKLIATAYCINANGMIIFWSTNHIDGFKEHPGTEKKWEDMFPNGSSEIGNPSQGQQSHDHECWLYYSHTQDCCLKCHPERDLRQQQIWGILDTARREREYIEEVKKGK